MLGRLRRSSRHSKDLISRLFLLKTRRQRILLISSSCANATVFRYPQTPLRSSPLTGEPCFLPARNLIAAIAFLRGSGARGPPQGAKRWDYSRKTFSRWRICSFMVLQDIYYAENQIVKAL